MAGTRLKSDLSEFAASFDFPISGVFGKAEVMLVVCRILEGVSGIRITYKDSGFRILKMVSLKTCNLLEAEDEKYLCEVLEKFYSRGDYDCDV